MKEHTRKYERRLRQVQEELERRDRAREALERIAKKERGNG